VHALADINEAVKIDITSAPYRRTRALVFWLSGKDDEAAKDAEEAIWLDTSVALPYVIRGRVKAKQNQFLPAIEDFTHALKLTPGDAEVLFERGTAYMQLQQWHAALADEDLVLQQKPNFALAWFVRALAKRALGDGPGSDADFDAAAKLNPNLKKPDLDPKAPG
jgi:Tfp pilus assembly protein PilF